MPSPNDDESRSATPTRAGVPTTCRHCASGSDGRVVLDPLRLSEVGGACTEAALSPDHADLSVTRGPFVAHFLGVRGSTEDGSRSGKQPHPGESAACMHCAHGEDEVAVPDLLTPPEVGATLRRRRTWTYAQLKLFISSGGTHGVPCIRDGPNYFTPRRWLEAFVGYWITNIPPHNGWKQFEPNNRAAPRSAFRSQRRADDSEQLDLPFEA